jgi:hypothetical protein
MKGAGNTQEIIRQRRKGNETDNRDVDIPKGMTAR